MIMTKYIFTCHTYGKSKPITECQSTTNPFFHNPLSVSEEHPQTAIILLQHKWPCQ